MPGVYKTIFALLDVREKRRFCVVLTLILAMGLTEVVGVASILPFLSVLADPSVVETNPWLAQAYALGGFETPRAFLIALGAGVFALFLAVQAVKALTFYAVTRFSGMRSFSLGQKLMNSYLAQPYVWHLGRHSAELGKSLLSEVDLAVEGAILPAMYLVAYGVVALVLTALIVMVDPVVAMAAAATIGGAYVSIYLLARRLLTRLGTERFEANEQRYRIAQEAFGGIKEVKVLGLEESYAARFRAPARRFAVARALTMIVSDMPRHVMEALMFGGMILLVLVKLAMDEGGFEAMVPILGVYAFAGARLFPAMQRLYAALSQLRVFHPTLMRLSADLAANLCLDPSNGKSAALPPMRSALRLEGVRYGYPGAAEPALRGVDMEIRARTTVGIVGGSGAGKTTLVDMILGLLTPDEGHLRVDGVVIDARNVTLWRQSVGYVPQQIFLADDTIAANIAFGVSPEVIDSAAVERAGRIAELHEFVGGLPDGYATHVGERGVRLSGGQRQRIGIARALYRDPDVLIFDEATAALDTLTERAVMDAVHNVAHAKTVVMIAHRLSTVMTCDEIFLMEDGKVKARGTYGELIEQSERFRAMTAV